jgi:hypothetical protein
MQRFILTGSETIISLFEKQAINSTLKSGIGHHNKLKEKGVLNFSSFYNLDTIKYTAASVIPLINEQGKNKTYNIWVSKFKFVVPVKFDKKSVNFKFIIS